MFRFCKGYETLYDKAVNALRVYASDVKIRKFPESGTHTFKMDKSTLDDLKEWMSSQ